MYLLQHVKYRYYIMVLKFKCMYLYVHTLLDTKDWQTVWDTWILGCPVRILGLLAKSFQCSLISPNRVSLSAMPDRRCLVVLDETLCNTQMFFLTKVWICTTENSQKQYGCALSYQSLRLWKNSEKSRLLFFKLYT